MRKQRVNAVFMTMIRDLKEKSIIKLNKLQRLNNIMIMSST